MLRLFKRKSVLEKLQDRYNKLMEAYYDLSKVNRKEAEKQYVQAEAILVEIKSIQENS